MNRFDRDLLNVRGGEVDNLRILSLQRLRPVVDGHCCAGAMFFTCSESRSGLRICTHLGGLSSVFAFCRGATNIMVINLFDKCYGKACAKEAWVGKEF